MKVDDLIPNAKNKVQFKFSTYKSVPKDFGCYVLTTFNNDILYIGLATNLHSRFLQHLESAEKTNPTMDGKVIWFYYVFYDSGNLPKLERTWLNQYTNIHGKLPILNKINSPIG